MQFYTWSTSLSHTSLTISWLFFFLPSSVFSSVQKEFAIPTLSPTKVIASIPMNTSFNSSSVLSNVLPSTNISSAHDISMHNSSTLILADAIINDNSTSNLVANQSAMCDSIFDGLHHWPAAAANTVISIECHEIFAMTMGHDVDQEYQQKKHYANRKCLANGSWGWSNWTNYTECLNLLAMQEKSTSAVNQAQEIVSYVVLIFLIASLVSLILSIVIFISFKPLQCLRIRVHKNLCVALLMNCCLYIIMNSLVGIHKMDLSVTADWFCKTLKCLNVYSSMATINWMFVEGFLFHRRLYAPFHQNTKMWLIGYYVIGWGLPGICVLAWSLSLEFASVVSHKPCWEGYRTSNTIFIVSTPMIIAVGINFLFLISIIRLLVTKLRADQSHSDQATIKAIKATALLIPLLGIHHMVVLYNPSTFNRKLVNIYIVINVLFQSVQGIIVSVLYCFTNNEVRSVLNSAWSRRRMSHSFVGGGNQSAATLGHNSLLSKRRRQSAGSNSFNSLITQNQVNLNNNHLPPLEPNCTNGKQSQPSHESISASVDGVNVSAEKKLTMASMERNANSFPTKLLQASITDL